MSGTLWRGTLWLLSFLASSCQSKGFNMIQLNLLMKKHWRELRLASVPHRTERDSPCRPGSARSSTKETSNRVATQLLGVPHSDARCIPSRSPNTRSVGATQLSAHLESCQLKQTSNYTQISPLSACLGQKAAIMG